MKPDPLNDTCFATGCPLCAYTSSPVSGVINPTPRFATLSLRANLPAFGN